MDPLTGLRTRIASMKRPGLATAAPKSRRELGEERATAAFCAAFIAMGVPENELAKRLGVCTRMIRDWRAGARCVPGWVFPALPRDGQVAALEVLADCVPERDEDLERGAA